MPDETDQSASGRRFSVFIVEDEFLIAMDLADLLENGHSVVGPTTSVEAALRVLETERPKVALLDVNLRGKLVTPVAERLRSLGIPFVVSSAYPSFDFRGSQLFMDAQHLGKPIDEKRLVEALNRAVV